VLLAIAVALLIGLHQSPAAHGAGDSAFRRSSGGALVLKIAGLPRGERGLVTV